MKHRIRVVGILCRGEHILLVEQQNPYTGSKRWSLPGGGLELSDPDVFAGVEREVLEETGLQVRAGRIRFISEYANLSSDNPLLSLMVWIECRPLENEDFGVPTLANTLPDDYITGVRWWHRSSLPGNTQVSATLQRDDFWAMLETTAGKVLHLGRRTE